MSIEKVATVEKNNVIVYNATTKPNKPKRRDKSDLGPNFVAPDGGWGWVICIAAGITNFSVLPAVQQFGLIYRRRLAELGFSGKEISTIANIEMSVASLVGIVNGAMFRRFSFRQVAIVGSLLAFMGVFLTAWSTTFWEYVLNLSVIYGIGQGLSMAAVSLAVNTYFKNLRRRATGFAWTISGFGSIILPHLATLLLIYYGSQGTILIFAALILNALMCALTLQPVMWHVPKSKDSKEENSADTADQTHEQDAFVCKYCQYKKYRRHSIFSSQYLFNEDDLETPGYEITEPGTPMMARANDGWFGSKVSLAAEMNPKRLRHKAMQQISLKAPISEADHEDDQDRAVPDLNKPNYFKREHEDYYRYTSRGGINSKHAIEQLHCTCAEEKAMLENISEQELKSEQEKLRADDEEEELTKSKMSFKQKVVKFFDLDLLKDFTFVNLAMGMTIMVFVEINFSVLTPFILSEYGYTNEQISTAMSMLAGMDICVRFFSPFVLEKVKLGNQILFAFGIVVLSIGRLFLTMTTSYYVVLGLFVLMGFGKGFRTIFAPLIIPSYVPLKRLPAASGLQLVFLAIFGLTFGPVLGIISDASSYTNILHFFNLLNLLALLLWIGESVVRHILGRKAKRIED